jgi:chromosome segregation ATPase
MAALKSIEDEIDALDRQVAELEAEEAGLPTTLSWKELQESGALQKVEEADRRRGVIPRMLTAARVRRLELEIQKHEQAIADLEARQEEIYTELEPKRQQLLELQQEVAILGNEHIQSLHRADDKRRRISALRREIDNLQAGNG